MKNLKTRFLNSFLAACLFWPPYAMAIPGAGGEYELTKCLIGESGVSNVTSPDYSSAYSVGEDVAGTLSRNAEYEIVSGYFSGYASGSSGTFNLVNATVGTSQIFQDGMQIGVPVTAKVQLSFSSAIDPTTIFQGIQLFEVMDHLAQPQNSIIPTSFNYDISGTTIVITAQSLWPGNTLLDVVINNQLQSIDGFVLAQTAHTPFITVLDPNQENVVLHPIPHLGGAATTGITNSPVLHLDIPSNSLSDFAYVRVSQDPVRVPLLTDPQILHTATERAKNSGGLYQTPLAYAEVVAYNTQNQPMSLSKAMRFSISAASSDGLVSGVDAPVRMRTLSLWKLDAEHALWVKMPDTRSNGQGVAGAVTQFSVYALMGSADGNASNAFVFPVPWRPNGPDAGIGLGKTGTESNGITFSNLPSECTISIYTVSGSLVRRLSHSDLAGPIGQEKWDGNTSSGDHAASGVYLWRVESSADSKNGKLIVIR